MTQASSPSEHVLNTLRDTPTGYVCDALNKLGLSGAMRSIRPARGFEDMRLVGPALTLEIKPVTGFTGKNLSPYEIYAGAKPGQVSVIAGGGLEKVYTGDNQANMAKSHGIAGLVIDGGARDVAGIRGLGLPLWYTGAQTERHEPGTVISAVNVPVTVGGIVVNPDDIIVADEDGVVVIPLHALDAVMTQVIVISEIEEEMDKLIARGASLNEIQALTARKSAPAT